MDETVARFSIFPFISTVYLLETWPLGVCEAFLGSVECSLIAESGAFAFALDLVVRIVPDSLCVDLTTFRRDSAPFILLLGNAFGVAPI